ncbi:MAG: UDP-N-acetylmuramate--L-alanine ligase [Salibacteraceae bacterium]
MDQQPIKKIFFLGIGGIGMSAIARYYNFKKLVVKGFDKTYTRVTNDLEEEGIEITYQEDPTLVDDDFDLVVWTPAIKEENKLFQHFKSLGIPIKKRSEVLGTLTKNTDCIAVAGTHGKTTVSTLIAHLLKDTGKGCNAFLGGISSNYNTNFLFDEHSNLTVVEADEFDRSFLRLNPLISVVTSTDADHLDIYSDHNDIKSTFSEFAKRTNPEGVLFYKKGIELDLPYNVKSYSYSIEESADFFATNIFAENGESVFNFNFDKTRLENLRQKFPGKHNVENATVALAVCKYLGIGESSLRESLYNFKGIERRFQVLYNQNELTYIDDYAHHPEELKSVILSARQLYPGRSISVIFQPHLYSRTRDFASEFATSLSLADQVFLLPIYPARELPIEGINSEMLIEKIDIKNKKLVKKETITSNDFIKTQHLQVLMTLGAGDIGQLTTSVLKQIEELYSDV